MPRLLGLQAPWPAPATTDARRIIIRRGTRRLGCLRGRRAGALRAGQDSRNPIRQRFAGRLCHTGHQSTRNCHPDDSAARAVCLGALRALGALGALRATRVGDRPRRSRTCNIVTIPPCPQCPRQRHRYRARLTSDFAAQIEINNWEDYNA